MPYIAMREHMHIDYVWRYDSPKYGFNDIELAAESENQEKRPDELIRHEVQNLIDVRARYKVAIFYPALGDEEELLQKTSKAIKSELRRIDEEYLLILGYHRTTRGKRALLWKGYFFDKKGD